MKNLVIVESPAKTKKLTAFLGKDYRVLSSVGHIRDLPKSKLGVDVEHSFDPVYEISPGKQKIVKELKNTAKNSDVIYLATDPDREGEAIAWHVAVVLNNGKELKDVDPQTLGSLKNKAGKNPVIRRVSFNSITKQQVLDAFDDPRDLNYHLIDAQQARRILDRLVGYKLSPFLWKKIRYGLSAGRVQSVAVRFIVERERERDKFDRSKYFEISGHFTEEGLGDKERIIAKLKKIDGENVYKKEKFKLFTGDYFASKTILDAKRVGDIKGKLKDRKFIIKSIDEKETKSYPPAPFTTASLQQAASSRLGFSPRETMRLAQGLYEDGLITYMRTDSLQIVPEEVKSIRKYINNAFGSNYLQPKQRYFASKKGKLTQEAHEAIRPTDIGKTAENLPKSINLRKRKLYKLIQDRTAATQMAPAVYANTKIQIEDIDGKYTFEVFGSVPKFDGFTKTYKSRKENIILPRFKKGSSVALKKLDIDEKEMLPPARYNEASLVKELEKFNIGRPSTYAVIVSTIQTRGYVKKEDKSLYPSDNGLVVNDLLVKHFKQIVDVDFTADMEEGLDEVALGDLGWKNLIKDFYNPFDKLLIEKDKEVKKEDIVILEKTNKKCPECTVGKLVVRLGRYGKFLSCDRYPDCKYAEPVEDKNINGESSEAEIDLSKEKCPKCSGKLSVKDGRFGKFIACKNYPDCKYTRPILNKIGMECPDCGKKDHGEVIIRRTRKGRVFYGCSRYPDCKYSSWKKPSSK